MPSTIDCPKYERDPRVNTISFDYWPMARVKWKKKNDRRGNAVDLTSYTRVRDKSIGTKQGIADLLLSVRLTVFRTVSSQYFSPDPSMYHALDPK